MMRQMFHMICIGIDEKERADFEIKNGSDYTFNRASSLQDKNDVELRS